MSEHITINRPIPIRTTTNGLIDWLTDYYRSKHGFDSSVWPSYDHKTITINYHTPSNAKILLTLRAYDDGDLTIVSFSYPANWEEYTQILIEAIRRKFGASPSFDDFSILVHNQELAKVLQNRFYESQKVIEVGAHLSVIVMLGSILEAVLFDKAKQYPREVNLASAAPKDSSNNVLPIEKWSFENLIGVAQELGWLDNRVPESARDLMRYRNLVHAREQIREAIYPNDGTCEIAKAIVLAALKDIIHWNTQHES